MISVHFMVFLGLSLSPSLSLSLSPWLPIYLAADVFVFSFLFSLFILFKYIFGKVEYFYKKKEEKQKKKKRIADFPFFVFSFCIFPFSICLFVCSFACCFSVKKKKAKYMDIIPTNTLTIRIDTGPTIFWVNYIFPNFLMQLLLFYTYKLDRCLG